MPSAAALIATQDGGMTINVSATLLKLKESSMKMMPTVAGMTNVMGSLARRMYSYSRSKTRP